MTSPSCHGDDEQAAHFENLKRTQGTWREDVTLESFEHVIDFRPIDVVAEIAPRASCLIAAADTDMVHLLDQILEAYERCREPRRLHLLPERARLALRPRLDVLHAARSTSRPADLLAHEDLAAGP